MNIKPVLKLTAVMLLLGMMSSANAVSISLLPSFTTAAPGDTVSFDILYDFSADPTLGGGLDVTWDDSVLNFASFNVVCGAACDPGFTNLGVISAGLLSGFAVGNFGGISGPLVVATLDFMIDAAATAGTTGLGIGDTADPAIGPFVSANTFTIQNVDYFGAELEIQVDMPVPEPATWMLMLGGLGAMLRFRRRQP